MTYYERNKEKINEASRKYYQEHKEKWKEYNNKEELREYHINYSRKYYKENKEKINEYCKKYRKENEEHFKQYLKEYRQRKKAENIDSNQPIKTEKMTKKEEREYIKGLSKVEYIKWLLSEYNKE